MAFAQVHFHEITTEFLGFEGFLFWVDKLKLGFFLLSGKVFIDIVFDLITQDGSAVTNVETEEPIFVLKNRNHCGSTELSINLTTKKRLIGFCENVQNDLLHFAVLRLRCLFF
jgi:hypothetical protein